MRNNILAIFFLLPLAAAAQELNCSVQVLHPQLTGTNDKQVLEELEKSVFEFMNNSKWTKDTYTNEERIECSITITINERSSTDEFKGSIQVQSRRPVYKSSYNSTMFNWSDNDFQFRYLPFQAMEFSETQHMSNLTSVLAYYANIILAIDYDSFSLKGGEPFYRKAQTIVTNAGNAPEKGWRSFDSQKNRYWLVENMFNPIFAPLRESYYFYHRMGMDLIMSDKEAGRQGVFEAIKLVKTVHQQRPGSFNVQLFFMAKSEEIVNVFSIGFPDEKTKVVNLLNEIDPAHSTQYQKILASGQ